MVRHEVRATGRRMSRGEPSGCPIGHPARRLLRISPIPFDTGTRRASNACSGEPGEVPDHEVDACLGNPGLSRDSDSEDAPGTPDRIEVTGEQAVQSGRPRYSTKRASSPRDEGSTSMKASVWLKGIFYEGTPGTRGLSRVANIKGTLTLRQFRTALSPPWEIFNRDLYSTLNGHFGPGGDTRSISLLKGDLLLVQGGFYLDLQDPIPGVRPEEDYIVISGDLLGGFKTLTVTRGELINLTRPKAVHLEFTKGNTSVRANFEVRTEPPNGGRTPPHPALVTERDLTNVKIYRCHTDWHLVRIRGRRGACRNHWLTVRTNQVPGTQPARIGGTVCLGSPCHDRSRRHARRRKNGEGQPDHRHR